MVYAIVSISAEHPHAQLMNSHLAYYLHCYLILPFISTLHSLQCFPMPRHLAHVQSIHQFYLCFLLLVMYFWCYKKSSLVVLKGLPFNPFTSIEEVENIGGNSYWSNLANIPENSSCLFFHTSLIVTSPPNVLWDSLLVVSSSFNSTIVTPMILLIDSWWITSIFSKSPWLPLYFHFPKHQIHGGSMVQLIFCS